jgi:hypothetical protein
MEQAINHILKKSSVVQNVASFLAGGGLGEAGGRA